MSFREIDEGLRRQARKPQWAERWLRAVFIEDWGTKLLALVIALALWYGVTGQRKPTTIRVPRVPSENKRSTQKVLLRENFRRREAARRALRECLAESPSSQ